MGEVGGEVGGVEDEGVGRCTIWEVKGQMLKVSRGLQYSPISFFFFLLQRSLMCENACVCKEVLVSCQYLTYTESLSDQFFVFVRALVV